MITAFMSANELHAVYVIKREGMAKIQATGFCTVEDNAGPGVYQLPEWAFDGRPTYGPPGGEIAVCAKCSQIVGSMKHPR
jgi:hypothetical protein